MSNQTQPRFSIGDQVRLKAQPERAGLITALMPYAGGFTYGVFFSALDVSQVNEDDLEPAVRPSEVAVLPRDDFLRALLITKLDNPINDLFYAYQSSRTQFEAYQFKPVLKFLDSPVPSILIADEVGLGKTIEAAILLQELKARGAIRRVLVICPAGLREKWQRELLIRFDEQFQIMRRPQIMEDVRLYGETNGVASVNGIVSLESFRAQEIQDAIRDAGVTFDLVIIDEAHHLRTQGTLSNAVGELMQEMAEHLILLTATPLQTGQKDLFELLHFIDPEQFSQYDDFVLQLEPNADLNAAIRALRGIPPDLQAAHKSMVAVRDRIAGEQVTSHPTYPLVMQALNKQDLPREQLVRLRRDIDSLNVLSPVYTRTKKGDISRVARRSAHVINVETTPEEAAFIEAVLDYARRQTALRTGRGAAPGWAGMMRERQAASSISAMRGWLQESVRLGTATGRSANLQEEGSYPDAGYPSDGAGAASNEMAGLDVLAAAANAVGNTDTKFSSFLTSLTEVLNENPTSKVIVFTNFRRTLSYLERALTGRGIRPTVIHGDVKPEDRAVRIGVFRDDPKARVLLSTEVGSEGLDFQFCDTIFNYDLPWNPMRVEQRIGRIDRYGQTRDQIRIYSFFMAGTIEERILERLYTRIGIFEQSVGDLEPILGPISSELTREIFRSDLTPEQEIEAAEKYERMIIERRDEEVRLEQASSKLLGQDALLLQAIEDSVRSGRYVSASELRAVVSAYLYDVLRIELIDRVGDGTVLVPSDPALRSAIADYLQRTRDMRPVGTAFLNKMAHSSRVAATFSGDQAHRSPLLELLSLRHPLVRMAIDHYRTKPRMGPYPFVSLRASPVSDAESDPLPTGEYEFVLFLLELGGATSQVRLVPVVFDQIGRRSEPVENQLLRVIQETARDEPGRELDERARDELDARARRAVASVADQLQADAIERNEAALAVRKATLERTFGHRIRRRRRQLAHARDDRIRRMFAAALSNLETDFDRRLAELEQRRQVSVSTKTIGAGRLVVATESVDIPQEVEVSAVRERPVAPAPQYTEPSPRRRD